MCQYCEALIKALDRAIEKADDDLADILDEEGYIKAKKTVKTAAQLEEDIAKALLEETDYITGEMAKAVDLKSFMKDMWPTVQISDVLDKKLSKVFAECFKKFMPQYTQYYLQQTDRSLVLDQVSKRTTAWITEWSDRLGEIMKLNSCDELSAILEKNLQEGNGIEEITRQIYEAGIRNERYRARRVALTEILRAHSVAQQEAYMQSPAVTQKMWKHTGSYRNQPRPNHEDMSGTVVAVDKPYHLLGQDGMTYYDCMYPRDIDLPPEESINCHCISQPVVDSSILGIPLSDRILMQQQAVEEMDDEWEKELDARNRAKAGIE